MWSVLTLHRWGLFRLATFFNQFFKQSNWKFRVRLRYGLSKVYPTFIKSGQSFPPPAQLRLWCFLEPFLSRLGDPERSRCRRRRPPRWLRSRSAGGADIAAGLTAAAGTDPPWLIKFENLFFLICFFLFFEAKERNPKTSETKDIARELAVDRGSASQVGQDLWSLDSNFEQLVPNNLKNEEEKKIYFGPRKSSCGGPGGSMLRRVCMTTLCNWESGSSTQHWTHCPCTPMAPKNTNPDAKCIRSIYPQR